MCVLTLPSHEDALGLLGLRILKGLYIPFQQFGQERKEYSRGGSGYIRTCGTGPDSERAGLRSSAPCDAPTRRHEQVTSSYLGVLVLDIVYLKSTRKLLEHSAGSSTQRLRPFLRQQEKKDLPVT